MYTKYNVKEFTKWCFTLWFYNVFKAMFLKDETLLTKNPAEK